MIETCNEAINFKGLPQKSNDFLSLFKVYTLTASFNEIVKSLNKIPPTFTIITKNNKYRCHLEIAAAVSDLIFSVIQGNPNITEFRIKDDFDDSKFDLFASFLNGSNIDITNDNRSYFKSVAEMLKIDQNYFDPDNQKQLSLNKFSKKFHQILSSIPKTVILSTNKNEYSVNYLTSLTYSQALIQASISNSNHIKMKLKTIEDISEIVELLNFNSINVGIENFNTVKEAFSELEITLLNDALETIMSNYKYLMPMYANINLQDTVLDLSDTNIDDIHQLLSKSEYYINSDLHSKLCLALELTFEYRPRYFKSVIKLISLLHNDSFHKSLIKYLKMRIISLQLSIPFLRSLYDSKNINHEELIEILKIDLDISTNSDYTFNSQRITIRNDLYVFFASDFIKLDKEKLLNFINEKNQFFSRDSRKVTDLLPYVDNWDKYENEVNMNYIPNSLYAAILDDDADSFQRISSQQPNFDFDQKIKPFLFQKSKDLYEEVTYSDLAAFYGSIRCFRFLLLQKADVYKSVKYALYGGNPEIIRLIEQDGADFSNMVYCTIKYHRYDIFKWLLTNHGPIKSVYFTNDYRNHTPPALPTAIKSYNSRVLLHFYEIGIDNEVNSDYMPSLLGISLQVLNIDAMRLLLTTYLVDVNKVFLRSEIPPICYASTAGCLEAVRMLIEIGKCNLPKNCQYDPLMLATKLGYEDIIQYLTPLYK